MRVFGYIFLAIGLLIMLISFNINISIESTAYGGRIINSGFVADRQFAATIGGFLAVVGSVLIAAGAIKKAICERSNVITG
jgi:hypothetical protein